ncbi:hypothetical protein OSH08_04320 [Kaistia geumhonensis]|uniref:hypothetical protein n=1 Tax=Kaistia geumhonensis TaxID=410839 RepID=UPI00225B703A|nr:hypothetical protein [Kaistia geumhonensis]MCX5478216.1 hypothetical protein [Kaistia geumhonensis]
MNAFDAMSTGGISLASISSQKCGLPRLVPGVTGFLYREQQDAILDDLSRDHPRPIVLVPEIRARLGPTGSPFEKGLAVSDSVPCRPGGNHHRCDDHG